MTPEQTLAAHLSRAALIDEILADLHERPAEDLRVIHEILRVDRLTAAEAGVGGEGTSTAVGLVWTDVRSAFGNVAKLLEHGERAAIGGRGRIVRQP